MKLTIMFLLHFFIINFFFIILYLLMFFFFCLMQNKRHNFLSWRTHYQKNYAVFWHKDFMIFGLMILTLLEGHRFVRNINPKVHVWIIVFCSLRVVWLLHTLIRLCTIWFVWPWCVFRGDDWHVFVYQVSGLVRNFNIGIYSDTITVINVYLSMIVLLIELYLFIPVSVMLIIFSRSQQYQTFLIENFVFLSS